MRPDEKKPQAARFLPDAVANDARLGVVIKRLPSDHGAAFRWREFAAACKALGITHKFTRPYRPQTNGKAERGIQSALRDWAYGWTYQNSAQRDRRACTNDQTQSIKKQPLDTAHDYPID